MITTFNAKTADDLWRQLTSSFSNATSPTRQPSRAGGTLESLHVAISVEDPIQRWIALRNPPINLAFALAETVWILSGRNDAAFLNYFNSKLPEYAGKCDAYHGAYGHRLRRHFGLDQIERAFEVLSRRPHSRQVVLQIWDVNKDIPERNGDERSADIPCNVISLLKLRDGKLEWTQIMRSNDLFRGLPYNIVQFTTLQEVLAGWLQVGVGSYNHFSDSLHVYDQDLENIKDLGPLDIVEQNCDRLISSKADCERHFAALATQVEHIIDARYVVSELARSAFENHLPAAFKNILLILTAEGARRRKSPHVTRELVSACSNPLFCHMYNRWLLRVGSGQQHST